MKRFMKKAFCTLCVISVLGSSAVYAAQTDTKAPELPQKVQDIINGSKDIYGNGVPLQHGKGEYSTNFVSGGVNHTHQYIVANALAILSNDMGNSPLNSDYNAEVIMSNTDWPDGFGNETDFGTFAGHFYDPDTNKNWLGQTSPTAKTRADSYFNSAVERYKAGDATAAFLYLGRGTHYVSDANEPHHASNLTALNSNHTEFEAYVDANRTAYKIAGNTFASSVYQQAINTSVSSLIQATAKQAKALAGQAQDSSTYSIAGEKSVQYAIKAVTQYIYKFATEVGIY
ncbi:MAG: zinc dependent phospholipase C family protein [Anaerocolumna sp.]